MNMCSTVRNAKENYNEVNQVKALMPATHIFACFSTSQIQLHKIITCFYQVSKAAGMCSTVRDAKENYNELHQVKHWCQLHTFLTMLHMPAAFITWWTHVVVKCGHI
jgi:hypothetical protein